MGGLVNTLLRTVILDNAAYEEWRERPNLFLRGVVLILVVSLVAGLVTFAVDLVNRVRPVDVDRIQEEIDRSFEQQFRWNPAWQNLEPEAREIVDETMELIVPMVVELSNVESPLPQGISGFFQALGSWLSRGLSALGGWLLYGALVLIAVNLLGGSAKLGDFMGMVALYVIPGLLGLLGPVPCAGGLLGLIGIIWSIVVYVKAVSVATDLDTGKAVLAVFAPFIVLLLLGILLAIMAIAWLAIVF
jgi:hypothetical protein